MQLAMVAQNFPKAEVIEKDERDEPMQDQMGQTIGMRRVYDVKAKVAGSRRQGQADADPAR